MENPLQTLIDQIGLNPANDVQLVGNEGAIPSHFKIATAAATALAAGGIAADEIWQLSGAEPQEISVDLNGAAMSLLGFLCQRLDDNSHPTRDPNRALVAMYPTRDDRWIHLHGAFPTLAEGTQKILGCSNEADAVAAAVRKFNAQELEDRLAEAGMCGAMIRTREEWLAHPQGVALSQEAPIVIEKIGDSEPEAFSPRARPLENVKVLDLTRVLAGPTCARTLASQGANVLKVNSPNLPSVPPFVMDTGHGKRSTFLDLTQSDDVQTLKSLVSSADVFSQGYRKGALERKGFGPEQLSELRPGIIYISINAYGHVGPWATRPGWEQLAQSATGVAVDEGGENSPRLIAAAATDYTTGYLAACGAMTALKRRATEGGSYHVKVSLAQTANWLYELGLNPEPSTANIDLAAAAPYMTSSESGFGKLHHLGPILQMSVTPPRWQQTTVPLGTHPATW